ncbi:glycosyltransferase family 4 protein [Haladaptatus halobius]|uniref:glycosyltransferase family 4 protein n=1 Tax=Haladaptatus halobius TaxID=2884875 RepID=UPI001D0AC5EE|nr:glycosyltransferase family 4 protein [Haladaptatus halobius]
MRVLNCLPDPRVGGPQLRALSVAEKLRERGIETSFLLPNGTDAFEQRTVERGFDVYRPDLPRLRPPHRIGANARHLANLPSSTRQIARVFDAASADVAHVNGPLNVQAGIAAAADDVPLVWHFNDTSMSWPVTRIAAAVATRLADEIVVAADAVDDHYFSADSSHRTIYAPVDVNAFDPDRIDPSVDRLPEAVNVDSERTVIGAIGNLNPIKGYEYLLRATRRVVDRHGSVTVLIVGKRLETRAEYVRRLERLRSKLDLDGIVHFLGHRSDVAEMLALFDIFVLSSVAEACPMAVLEAMAMRRPIVATDVGGVSEQIRDGTHGWVVPPKESGSLATAVSQAICQSEERRRRGKRARRRAERVFSLARCADRHERAYLAAVDGEPAAEDVSPSTVS